MKKKKRKIITRWVKTVGAGLEGFVDWLDPPVSDPTEERKEYMSSLTAGFATCMCKRAVSAQGETTLGFEVFGRKRPKRSGLDEEAQKGSVVIIMDST